MNPVKEAEEQVLGIMLMHPRTVGEVAGIISGSDYESPRSEAVHDAIVDLYQSGADVNPMSVHAALAGIGGVGASVGLADLHDLSSAAGSPMSATYYAGVVRNAADLRHVGIVAERLRYVAESGSDDPLEAMNLAMGEISAMASARARDGSTSMESVVGDALASLVRVSSLPTPWRDLNRALSGWRPGHLYVVGARPAVGKSALLGNIALHSARLCSRQQEQPVVIVVSLEMPKEEFALRLMADMADVDGQRLLHRSTRDGDDDRLNVAAEELQRLPLIIEDEPRQTLAQIESRIRAVQARRPVALVAIDYLQIMGQSKSSAKKDRHLQVGDDAQGLKDMSKRLRLPVIALAQLNRAVGERAMKTPMMSDLRESGGIEAAADAIMLMHRLTMAQEINGLGDSSDLELNLEKNRQGPQDLIRLKYIGEHFRFVDREWQAAP